MAPNVSPVPPAPSHPWLPRGVGTRIACAHRLWWLARPGCDTAICLDPLLRRSGWNVSELARILGTGTRTLTRAIESSTGMTAKSWLRRQRAVTARHLLREGWKIEALSAELGFRNPSAFTREFKSVMGVTPSIYLRQEQSRFFLPPPAP